MNINFKLKIKNNSNKTFKFINFISKYKYIFYISKEELKPDNEVEIMIEFIYGLPIICSLDFNNANLNIINQVQKHTGSSVFDFYSDNIKSTIIKKIRFQPKPDLPCFSRVEILLENS